MVMLSVVLGVQLSREDQDSLPTWLSPVRITSLTICTVEYLLRIIAHGTHPWYRDAGWIDGDSWVMRAVRHCSHGHMHASDGPFLLPQLVLSASADTTWANTT